MVIVISKQLAFRCSWAFQLECLCWDAGRSLAPVWRDAWIDSDCPFARPDANHQLSAHLWRRANSWC